MFNLKKKKTNEMKREKKRMKRRSALARIISLSFQFGCKYFECIFMSAFVCVLCTFVNVNV